jgi:hypothetical protein
MAGNYFLGNVVSSTTRNSTSTPSNKPSTVYGRVLDVVLDDSKILYDAQGSKLPIGAIIYQDINTPANPTGIIASALPSTNSIKQFPLVNEIVIIQTGPTPDFQENTSEVLNYYSSVLNIWGSPHHNALPTQGVDFQFPIGQGIPELKDINPLFPFPGDVLIEGRQGQSVRIGGYSTKENTITNNGNNGQPFIIISNGQIKTTNGIDYIVENINDDFNSLYFLSNHKIPLKSANTKRKSYSTVPKAPDQYQGNQVVLNGGRLYLNAKEESAFISAKESIGLNANTVNIDATDYYCVDAKKIYLGEKARTATASVQQPAVLGKQLENWLSALLDTLSSVADAMSTASAVGAGPVTQLNATGPALKATVQSLKTQFKVFQSKKVFTE